MKKVIKKIQKNTKNDLVIYQAKSGAIEFRGDFNKETIWATQAQIAEIFGVNSQAITKHITNIYKEKELSQKATCSKMEQVRMEGNRQIKRNLDIYNLDIVIAVGYRINSKIATQFRIWATKTLREHIVKGYTVNEKRLLQVTDKFRELQNTVLFLQEKSQKELLSGQENEVLNLLASYAKTLTILDEYDKGDLKQVKGEKAKFILTYEKSIEILVEVKKELMAKGEAGELFGNERDGSFDGIIKGLYQTFGGKELYATLETKAAHLLYLIIKDHPLSDGNKRTASFLFVYFLDKNNALYRKNGEKKINDNALAALALLIAESNPNEKDIMVALITQLLN
ncbi:MAG: virulence protein RhuM/Fic/DOC family protein [Candidatus Nomurabacteria bacterium]|nr:virulence protein RhuM/Fic/DOC family protein [Candidatus Nomurabacteria bacterium]